MSAEAQSMLRDYAGSRWPSLNHKGRITRLAGVLNLGFRRARSLYQNEPGARIRADEMAAIDALRQTQIEEGNSNDFMVLQERIARLEAMLAKVDPQLFDQSLAGPRDGDHRRRRDDVSGPTR